jgi:hypothetical protein
MFGRGFQLHNGSYVIIIIIKSLFILIKKTVQSIT